MSGYDTKYGGYSQSSDLKRSQAEQQYLDSIKNKKKDTYTYSTDQYKGPYDSYQATTKTTYTTGLSTEEIIKKHGKGGEDSPAKYTSNVTTKYQYSTSGDYKPYEPKVNTTTTYEPKVNTTTTYKPYEPKVDVDYKKYIPKNDVPAYQPKVQTTTTYQPPTITSYQSPVTTVATKVETKDKKNKKDKSKPKKTDKKLKEDKGTIKEQVHIHGESQWDKILKHCEETGQPFLDSDFKPTASNIGGDFDEATWERATKFYNNPKVFLGGIEPTDINQGELGDCYFLSSLASLCEWPQLVKTLIFSKKENKWGVYAARICWKGVWTEVLIDDFFPVQDGAPIFSHSNEGETWVLIMEKCWAKIHGNYAKIDGAFAREPLHDLTGAPAKTYKPEFGKGGHTKKNNFIWKRIKDGEHKNHAMCAGSVFYDDETDEAEYMENEIGLIPGHIYTLSSAMKIHINGKHQRIVRLRNPWGDHEWKGDLNDNDPIWDTVPEQTKKNIGYEKTENDGIFFMYYDDFCKHFDDVTICYQYPELNYKYDGIPIDITSGKEQFLQVHINTPGYYFFQFCQRSIRTAKMKIQEDPKIGNKFYSKVKVVVCHDQEEKPCFAFYGNRREVCSWDYIEEPKSMQPGDYWVYIQVEPSKWQQDDPIYGFGVYGAELCEPHKISDKQCAKFAEIARKVDEDDMEFCQ